MWLSKDSKKSRLKVVESVWAVKTEWLATMRKSDCKSLKASKNNNELSID
jgi:hypothetical protein